MVLRRISREFKVFAILLIAGVLLGNILLVMLSLMPMVYVALTFQYQGPSGIRLQRGRAQLHAFVSEKLEIAGDLMVSDGMGIVTLGDALPDHFRLVDGNNIHVVWKGRKELNVPITYTIECTKRGCYEIGQTRFETIHFSGLQQTCYDSADDAVELLVQQRPLDLRRMRDSRSPSKYPQADRFRQQAGAVTNDFKEIREYRPGDPFRSINWKASVRSGGTDASGLLVNEYEKEGKKTVWIFLDASSGMSVGSNVENSFEYGVQAAYGFVEFYLARSCRVGLCIYNSGKLVLPDEGRRQQAVISKMLLSVEMTQQKGLLKSSVQECRGHIIGSRPLFLVITRIRKDNVQELKDGIKDIRLMTGGRSQVMLLHVSGSGLKVTSDAELAGSVAADLSGLGYIKDVSQSGAMLIPWYPDRQSLSHLLISLRGR